MSRTILVVDDEPRITQIAVDYLRQAGFYTLSAGMASTPCKSPANSGRI